ncbi:hypothetical protein, partial [Isoptericola hypogeus]|uniref:hypothetical protein n=1 Tax=Isoptericola hypogeus TaxID=300179 RepID=UPI0031E36881
MTSTIDALALRRTLGRDAWLPPEPFSPDGWRLVARDGRSSIIVTVALFDDGADWIHASRTGPDRVPT